MDGQCTTHLALSMVTAPPSFTNGQECPGYLVPDVGFELTTYRLQGGCSTTELIRHILNYAIKEIACQHLGGGYRDRTCDLLVANQPLSQLS